VNNEDKHVTQKKQLGIKSQFVDSLKGLQEHAQMEIRDPFKITSILTVPDLTFKGYRHPQMSRQFIVTLNKAIEQKVFREKVNEAFGTKGPTEKT